MALPGKDNPFSKGLFQKPPTSSSGTKKTFVKIPLSTGVVLPNQMNEEILKTEENLDITPLSEELPKPTTVVQQSDSISKQESKEDTIPQQLYNSPTTKKETLFSSTAPDDVIDQYRATQKDFVQQSYNSSTTDSKSKKSTTDLQHLTFQTIIAKDGTDLQQLDNSCTTPRTPEKGLKVDVSDEKTLTNNSTTVVQQSNNRLPTEHTTKVQQSSNNAPKIQQQFDNGSTTGSTTAFTTEIQHSYNGGRPLSILFLSEFQRGIVEFIFLELRKRRTTETLPLRSEIIAQYCRKPARSVQTISDRLHDKGYIVKKYGVPGPTGGTVYSLPETIYQECLHSELINNKHTTVIQQLSNNPTTNHTTIPTTLVSSSSSSNLNKETTTDGSKNTSLDLPLDWKEIDFSCLAPYRFTENHLTQIFVCGKVTSDIVQESIYELHHDLTVNKNKSLRNPRNVLLSLLKKGTPYTSPGYVSEELAAQRRCLEELQRRNRELLEIKEKQKELLNLPVELDKEARFQTWLSNLSLEEKKQIAPLGKIEGSEMQLGLLRAHWTKLEN